MQTRTSRESGYCKYSWAELIITATIIVAIIAVLTAISLPYYIGVRATRQVAKQRAECTANLQLIKAAKAYFASKSKEPDTYKVLATDICGPGKFIPERLACPAGGVYAINRVGEMPTCSKPGHALPEHALPKYAPPPKTP